MKKSFNKLISNFNYSNLLRKKVSIYFILTNILVAFFGFVRSFVFMKFFDLEELGLITLIQTGAMFIGFFQIGLINGGYRIVALQKNHLTEKTNNVIFSYFGVLFLFLTLAYIGNLVLNIFSNNLIVLYLFIFGFSLLVFNWLTNTLIAERKHSLLNKVNFFSAIISVFCLPMAYYLGIYGGVFCLLIQPCFFSVCILIISKKLRPTGFMLNLMEIKKILNYGFIPFISGIFFLLYIQIERWSIIVQLGTAALGNLYLFFIVVALWILIPNSISNLFFPKAVIYFEQKKKDFFLKTIRKYFLTIFIYSVIGVSFILFFLQHLVDFFFPLHSFNVIYVFLALPGLVFRIMSGPISLYFNSIVKLKPIFWSDLIALILYVVIIFLLFNSNIFSLKSVIISFNIYFLIKLIYLLILFKIYLKKPLF
ncbi:hypothetical protein [Polaribacter vadi]|uniref:lipopolysaccharide biosynthesis protein n=1 Tax=Polaribacter vadi TaxID=1774273 RepID=UPI0030EC9ADB|tara:strand:+ start:14322 stop:15590 length:1269 start_codon:yes stop_codon:yes gene_type:complete